MPVICNLPAKIVTQEQSGYLPYSRGLVSFYDISSFNDETGQWESKISSTDIIRFYGSDKATISDDNALSILGTSTSWGRMEIVKGYEFTIYVIAKMIEIENDSTTYHPFIQMVNNFGTTNLNGSELCVQSKSGKLSVSSYGYEVNSAIASAYEYCVIAVTVDTASSGAEQFHFFINGVSIGSATKNANRHVDWELGRTYRNGEIVYSDITTNYKAVAYATATHSAEMVLLNSQFLKEKYID